MKHVIGRYVLILGLAAAGLVEWRNLADLAWMSGSHRGSGRRCTSDTGQLCRCSPTLHRRGRRARVLVLAAQESGQERRVWVLRPRTEADP